jgi:hypothetical protein
MDNRVKLIMRVGKRIGSEGVLKKEYKPPLEASFFTIPSNIQVATGKASLTGRTFYKT